jgi:alkylation response protein AidB-like acyl-CoA dehydrogenase
MGEPGEGWRVAITTLMNERLSIGSTTGGYITRVERLLDLARRQGADDVTRQRIARVYSLSRILEFLNYRIISKLQRGQIPTAEGSVSKLVLGDLASSATELTVDLLGPRGMLLEDKGLQRWFLSAPAFHIGGGTDEIQRNLIGERVLGLPREPRDDKDVPFSKTRLSR